MFRKFLPMPLFCLACLQAAPVSAVGALGVSSKPTIVQVRVKATNKATAQATSQNSGRSSEQSTDQVLKTVDNYLAQGFFSRAEKLLASALAQHPLDYRLNLEEARVLRTTGHFARAKELYLSLYEKQPGVADPLIALSQMSLDSLALDDALKYARQAVALTPSSKSANLALAAALIYNDLLDEANKTLNGIERKFALSPELCYLRYQYFMRSENTSAALLALEQAVELRPDNSAWLMDLAALYKRQGDFNASLGIMKRYIKQNPGSIEALSKIAALYEYNFHDYDRAIVAYQQILKVDPDIVDATVGIDRCKLKGDDLAAAIKDHMWKFLRQSRTFGDEKKPPGK